MIVPDAERRLTRHSQTEHLIVLRLLVCVSVCVSVCVCVCARVCRAGVCSEEEKEERGGRGGGSDVEIASKPRAFAPPRPSGRPSQLPTYTPVAGN